MPAIKVKYHICPQEVILIGDFSPEMPDLNTKVYQAARDAMLAKMWGVVGEWTSSPTADLPIQSFGIAIDEVIWLKEEDNE